MKKRTHLYRRENRVLFVTTITDTEPSTRPFVVAGMPMYNEEETIGSVVIRALRHVDKVVCIDDGSSDASARIAEACGATVVRHRINRGYGGALKTLFMKALEMNADALVLLDSDGQHEAHDIPNMLGPCLHIADLVSKSSRLRLTFQATLTSRIRNPDSVHSHEWL